MKRKIIFSLLLAIFVMCLGMNTIHEVSAAPCNPGNYTHYNEGAVVTGDHKKNQKAMFECRKVEGNNETNTDGSKYGANGLTVDGKNGPDWVRGFYTFLVQLSVAIGYLTEVAAMLVITYAAFLYTTSGGDPGRLRMAKMYVMYAVIGMFIGAFSLIIGRLIGGAI